MYIGIDLGTSSVKVVLMNEHGMITDEVSKSYDVIYPQENWAEQNPEDWYESTIEALKEIIYSNNQCRDNLKSIGFSGQMHGMVALDSNGKCVMPAILWCDQRTVKECMQITSYFGEKELGELVGNKALTGFTAPKILWLKNNKPKKFKQVMKYLLPKDYLRFKMSNEYATDYSDASGTLLLDVKNKCYSKEMLDYLGIDSTQLPKLYESYQVTSYLTRELKETLGLSNDVKLVAGAGDQAAGAIGSGSVIEGILTLNLGTSGVVFAPHKDYKLDTERRLHSFCHANGKYHSMGVMLSAGSCLKWWSEQIQNKNVNDLLNDVGDDLTELLFLPYLAGERTPYSDPYAKGTFIGATHMTYTHHMTKAILEGVSFGLKDSFDLMLNLDIPINEIRVIGGGSNSDKWIQVISDVFNHEICTINTSQGGALGAAILAAVGDGRYNSVEEATNEIISIDKRFNPQKRNVDFYKLKHYKYKELYRSLESYFESYFS